jgi:hypothetical protein
MNEDAASLRSWGVPQAILEHAAWPHPDFLLGQLPPIIVLPDEWTPDAEPGLDEVLAGLELGMGIMIPGDAEFDFRWLTPSVDTISSVSCWGNWALYRGHATLSQMRSLKSLIPPATDEVVDLSELLSLRTVLIRSDGLLSAAVAPSLVSLTLTGVRIRSELRVAPAVRDVGLEVGAVDLALLHQMPELRTLVIKGAPVLDVGPVGALRHLEVFKVFRSRRVHGVAALKGCTSLRELLLYQVSEVDDPEAILKLDLQMFEGAGGAFDEQFARTAHERSGWAVTVPRLRGRKRAPSPFIAETTTDDRVEITFSDFGWLNEQLGIAAEQESPLLSGQVEQLMREQLERSRPDWVESELLEFDSETDAARVIAPNSATAQLVMSALDELFLNERALRKNARRWMS